MLGTHPIVRFLNQYRREIRNVVLVVLVFFLILRVLNSMAEEEIEKELIEKNNVQMELTLKEENEKVIKSFLDYCIKGDESSAYALLSSKCKEELFKTIDDFNTKYILKYFSTNESYTINYKSNKNEEYNFSIKIFKDILSTGKIDSSYVIQNFTILKEDETYKIIINID